MTGYQVKMFGRWWRVPRWFFNWHYMRHHRKTLGLTRRQHKALRKQAMREYDE